MKKLIALVFVLLLAAAVTSASGDSKSGLFSYTLKGNGTAVITGFNWTTNRENDVYVPRMIDGYTVTEIGKLAFSSDKAGYVNEGFSREDYIYRNGVGEPVVVVLPDTISVINEKAFFCTNIASIVIPSSVQLIGQGAFAGCINLRQFSIEEGNQTYATISGVLYNKKTKELVCAPAGSNEKISIPNGIISIGEYAFYGQEFDYGETYPKIPLSVKRINAYAFAYSNFHPDKHSGESYFNLNQIEEIGDHAFESSIFGVIKMDSVKIIGEYSFFNAQCLIPRDYINPVTLQFPSSLERIGNYAFSGFHNGTKNHNLEIHIIDLSNTQLTEIPPYAFAEFSSTDWGGKIRLPDSLLVIGEHAFENCRNGFFSIGDYITVNIPRNVTKIDAYAFNNTYINLQFQTNGSLKEIGDYAFYSCGKPEKIILPNTVERLGDYCFYSSEVKTISIPSSVLSIGKNVCDRAVTKLNVESGTYAALYASENGYATEGNEDTSWLSN